MQPAPSPEDVLWPSLWASPADRRSVLGIVMFWYAILYLIPTGACGSCVLLGAGGLQGGLEVVDVRVLRRVGLRGALHVCAWGTLYAHSARPTRRLHADVPEPLPVWIVFFFPAIYPTLCAFCPVCPCVCVTLACFRFLCRLPQRHHADHVQQLRVWQELWVDVHHALHAVPAHHRGPLCAADGVAERCHSWTDVQVRLWTEKLQRLGTRTVCAVETCLCRVAQVNSPVLTLAACLPVVPSHA